MSVKTIEDIRNRRDSISVKLKNIDVKKFGVKTFGSDREYTYESLIENVDSLLTDLSTLVENEDNFLKLSDYSDRRNMIFCLDSILFNIENPSGLCVSVGTLKKELRNYNIRNFSEHQIEFKKEIDEVRKTKIELQKLLKESQRLKQDIEKINSSIGEDSKIAEDNLNQSIKILSNNETQQNEISRKIKEQDTLITQLSTIKSQATQYLTDITNYKSQAEANKNVTENFSKSLQEKEEKLIDVEKRVKTNTDNFDKYEEERKKILTEANTLIKSAKQALEYKTAEGLSAAFSSQHKQANSNWYLLWILGAVICLGVAGYFGWKFMESVNENNQWFIILGRILLLPIPIMGAIFCANQYTKQKNIAEDYAYKQTIAKAIVGFSEQLKKNGKDGGNSEYVSYIRQALEEIHKNPLRNRKEDKPLLNLKNNQLDQVIELAKKIIDIGKQGN